MLDGGGLRRSKNASERERGREKGKQAHDHVGSGGKEDKQNGKRKRHKRAMTGEMMGGKGGYVGGIWVTNI